MLACSLDEAQTYAHPLLAPILSCTSPHPHIPTWCISPPGVFETSAAVLGAIEPFVYEWVAARRGSISAEHGIGVMKPQFLHMSHPNPNPSHNHNQV